MPFRSRAQRRKFLQLLREGKISEATFREWERASKGKKLPERVKPKKKKTRKTRKRRK